MNDAIIEKLTWLYLESLDLSGKTPEEIAQLYFDADKRIKAEYKRLKDENKVSCKQVINY